MTVTRHCRSGKVQYRDQEEAKRVITNARQKIDHGHRDAHQIPVRAYLCPECHRYHLTSKESY